MICAVFLINHLPSPKQFTTSILFKSFLERCMIILFLVCLGVLVHPLLGPYNSHKFSYHSRLCVFLGYIPKHEGYRCLLPSTNREYIARNIIFDETHFPFTSNPAPSSHPLELIRGRHSPYTNRSSSSLSYTRYRTFSFPPFHQCYPILTSQLIC